MSKQLLIIEDDRNKQQQLRDAVKAIAPHFTLFLTNSFNSGMRAVVDNRPDIILLDMSMPTFDVSVSEPGGSMRPFGGQEILRRLKQGNFTCRAIVITQFDRFGEAAASKTLGQLKTELRRDFPQHYVDTVSYSSANSEWRVALRSLLAKEGLVK